MQFALNFVFLDGLAVSMFPLIRICHCHQSQVQNCQDRLQYHNGVFSSFLHSILNHAKTAYKKLNNTFSCLNQMSDKEKVGRTTVTKKEVTKGAIKEVSEEVDKSKVRRL
jgi:hypothetical protein